MQLRKRLGSLRLDKALNSQTLLACVCCRRGRSAQSTSGSADVHLRRKYRRTLVDREGHQALRLRHLLK